MRTLIKLSIALPLLLTMPVAAQDFLAPLQDMVEQLTAPAERPRAAPKAVEAAPIAAPVPVPRPRPPSQPEVPEVAGAPVKAEPKPEPVVAPAAPADAPQERVYQVACPAVIAGLVEAEMAPPLSEGICGEQSPLVITGVISRGRMVPLSSPITTNCQMASALPDWVETVDGYAQTMLESRLVQVDTGTSYMCRNRYSAADGFTSEHGFANAVDVSGFTLEDGRKIGVAGDWLPASKPEGRLLRLAHDAACGDFMTVLGPEANADHRDHLHLDLGCHGQSCTTRICE